MPERIGATIFDRAVFIDTGALKALSDPADPLHGDAVRCAEEIARNGLPLYLGMPTLIEAHRLTLFARGRVAGRDLLDQAFDGSLNIVRLAEVDEANSRELLAKFHWVDLSFADALNMSMMARIGIRAAFTFDNDFVIAGFVKIPPFYPWWEYP